MLKWVDVSTNNLVGPIPPDICSGGALNKLILFSNGFNDSLSPSLSNCSSLVRLRLEENEFSGAIPLNFSLLPGISYVDLSRNRFTGGFPSDIHRALELQYFNISQNPGLGGVIPDSVWSSPSLQNFSASSCNLTGEIPGFKSCGPISVVELGNNDLSGSLPGSVSYCKDLERIDLSDNHLSGNLPEEVAVLPHLEYLDVSHNNFTGPLPSKFVNANSLKLLNVSYNDFDGRIPTEKVFGSMGSSAFYGNTRLCGWPLRTCPGSLALLGSKGTGKLLLILLLCAGAVITAVLVLGAVYYRLKGGPRGRWKMVCFDGLPQFKANAISKSLSQAESNDSCKPIILPTGNTVLVKRIDWDTKRMGELLQFVTGMGNARHENLVRLLGFCYDKDVAYLIYDHLPNGDLGEHIRMGTLKSDWTLKRRIITGIAKGLCFLHQDCFPSIPHGDLKSRSVMFDENMRPKLTDFGLSQLTDPHTPAKEQQSEDLYRFGEIILEVLSKGKLRSAGEVAQAKPKDMLLREIWDENEVGGKESLQEEIKAMLEVALMCTRSSRSNRPSIGEALKLLSQLDSP
ncbi:hypothetical protein MLD38_014954 [Melastoma candidum]|nr:hypothetical protein MLD38_014954 [Melastoma candidum]